MYCTNCGTWNPDEARRCSQCGNTMPVVSVAPGTTGGAPLVIPNYLVQATLVTLCCCLPLGIPAIVYGAQVRPKVEAGDIQGALEASRMAKLWSWIGLGVGAAGALLYVVAVVMAILAER